MTRDFVAQLAQLEPPIVGPTPRRTAAKQWRGVLIDSARTCFSVETICKTLHLMHRYGFNRLHWHLTDDAGWRFNVPEYPQLTAVGAFLPRSSFAHYHCLTPNAVEHGIEQARTKWRNGFYSDVEIARVVETAESLGIEIMPELDLPGHMKAAIDSYPSLGRPAGLPLPKWGRPNLEPKEARLPGANDLLWPTDEVVQFLQKVLLRLVKLFPHSRVIHIGGDECALHQWETDPQIGAHLKHLGLKNAVELQQWFMEQARVCLASAGLSVGVWDDVCELSPDFPGLVFAWEGVTGLQRVAKSTANFVYADCRFLYLNQVDPGKPEQLGMLPKISVNKILTDPWKEYYQERCLGVQASAWSEFILDETALFSHLFPRLLAVAERAWNPILRERAASTVEAVALEATINQEYQKLLPVLG